MKGVQGGPAIAAPTASHRSHIWLPLGLSSIDKGTLTPPLEPEP
jgi:hypothetical protein